MWTLRGEKLEIVRTRLEELLPGLKAINSRDLDHFCQDQVLGRLGMPVRLNGVWDKGWKNTLGTRLFDNQTLSSNCACGADGCARSWFLPFCGS